MNGKVAYSAIVLTDGARDKLLSTFGSRIPEGWEVIAHHCTVNMGELPKEIKNLIGHPVSFQAFGFYINDKVCACQCIAPPGLQPYMKNKYPHITLAVNRVAGGKPVMSNALIEDSVKSELSGDIVGTNTHTPLFLLGFLSEVQK